MITRCLFGLTAVLALIAIPASAQDPAGKWNLSVETPQGPFEMVFDFQVDGKELTGTLSNDFFPMPIPISEGMVDGNAVSFMLSMEGGGGPAMTIHYKGTVEGDTMKLMSTFEGAPPGGGPAEQELTATRAR